MADSFLLCSEGSNGLVSTLLPSWLKQWCFGNDPEIVWISKRKGGALTNPRRPLQVEMENQSNDLPCAVGPKLRFSNDL